MSTAEPKAPSVEVAPIATRHHTTSNGAFGLPPLDFVEITAAEREAEPGLLLREKAKLGRLVGAGVYDPGDFDIIVDERRIAAFDKRRLIESERQPDTSERCRSRRRRLVSRQGRGRLVSARTTGSGVWTTLHRSPVRRGDELNILEHARAPT